jgi:hypothetical protein
MVKTLSRALLGFSFVLAFSALAVAQQPATVLLKSGERVTGSLVDMTGSDFIMSVSGQERRFPISDAAVIDFSGANAGNLPSAEVQKAGEGQNLLVLKDGRQMQGKLDDVGGTQPLRISFTNNGQAQNFTSDQVSRVYLAPPSSGAVATSGAQGSQAAVGGGNAIRVAANQAWTPTAITVKAGQVLTFSSSGQVQLSTNATDTATVTGASTHMVPRGSLPTVPAGALIGRIGNGKPFGIGDQTTITAPASGPLYLGVNDDVFTDNTGEFNVTVTGGTTSATGIRRRQ